MTVGLMVNTPLGSLSVSLMSPVSAMPLTVKVLVAVVVTITPPKSTCSLSIKIVGSVIAPFIYQKLAVPSLLITISVTGLPR